MATLCVTCCAFWVWRVWKTGESIARSALWGLTHPATGITEFVTGDFGHLFIWLKKIRDLYRDSWFLIRKQGVFYGYQAPKWTNRGQNKKNTYTNDCVSACFTLWAQLGLNQWPPDYESGATNQLSYRPHICEIFVYLCKANAKVINFVILQKLSFIFLLVHETF